MIQHINKRKDKKKKKPVIMLIDTEIAFEKVQHPFMIKKKKTINKVDLEGTKFNIIKTTDDKHTANIILNGEKLRALPLKSGTRPGCPLSPLIFNILLEVLATAIREEKGIKAIHICKEDIKLSLFTDDIILHIENLKDSTKNLLELINEFSKVAGYKTKIQRSVSILYMKQ